MGEKNEMGRGNLDPKESKKEKGGEREIETNKQTEKKKEIESKKYDRFLSPQDAFITLNTSIKMQSSQIRFLK